MQLVPFTVRSSMDNPIWVKGRSHEADARAARTNMAYCSLLNFIFHSFIKLTVDVPYACYAEAARLANLVYVLLQSDGNIEAVHEYE